VNPRFARSAPGYFETMGIPLVATPIQRADAAGLPMRPVLINDHSRSAGIPARTPLASASALAAFPTAVGLIVGVVGDVKQRPGSKPIRRGVRDHHSVAVADVAGWWCALAVTQPRLRPPSARRSGRWQDQPVVRAATMEALLAARLRSPFRSDPVETIALVRLMLAVRASRRAFRKRSERTREIGVRLHLAPRTRAFCPIIVRG